VSVRRRRGCRSSRRHELPAGSRSSRQIYDINAHSLRPPCGEGRGRAAHGGIVEDDPQNFLSGASRPQGRPTCDRLGRDSAGAGDLLYRVIGKWGRPDSRPRRRREARQADDLAVSFGTDPRPAGLPHLRADDFPPFWRALLRVSAACPPPPRGACACARGLRRRPCRWRQARVPTSEPRPRQGGRSCRLCPSSESGAITTLAEADGFFEIPRASSEFAKATKWKSIVGESLQPLIVIGRQPLPWNRLRSGDGRQAAAGTAPKVIAIGSTAAYRPWPGRRGHRGDPFAPFRGRTRQHLGSRGRKLRGKPFWFAVTAATQVLALRPGAPRRVGSLSDLLAASFRSSPEPRIGHADAR